MSEQINYLTGTSEGILSGSRQTYYTCVLLNRFMDTIYLELFRYNAGTTTNLSESYWLSTRCTRVNTYLEYNICSLENGSINGTQLYASSGAGAGYAKAIRPVVEIDLSKASVGATGYGTAGDPYSITAK